jgi:uncharacterized membrane protein
MRRSTLAIFVLLASVSLLAACAGEDDPACEDTAPLMRGAMVIATECTGCHSTSATNRNGAPPAVNFDSPPDIDAHEAKIRNRALARQNMPPLPPLGPGPLEAGQIADVQAFLDCR